MRWASALTQQTDPLAAGDTLALEIREQLEGASAHLLLVFAQIAQADALGAVVERLQHAHPEARVVGCTGGSVLASGSEPEGRPAVAVLAAHLPDVAVVPFRVTEVLLRQVMADPTTWHRHLDLVPEQRPVFVLLPDPFTTRADALVASLDAAYPGLAKLGGLASGGREAGEHVLVLDHETHRDGTVAVALYGDIAADTVVAQGARPVGPKEHGPWGPTSPSRRHRTTSSRSWTAARRRERCRASGRPSIPSTAGGFARPRWWGSPWEREEPTATTSSGTCSAWSAAPVASP